METSLHRSLKGIYGVEGARTEAIVRGYRVDVLRSDTVVEIQASPLGAIARKVSDLVQHHRVLVVKPITHRKFILRQSAANSGWDLRRFSPKRGKVLDVFQDLVRFTQVFPHPNLAIDVLLVDEEELRVPRPRRRFRRPAFRIQDRRMVSIVASYRLETQQDLVTLLPAGIPAQFTTDILANHAQVPQWFARMVAYTLRHCGATRVTGKIGNRLVHELLPAGKPGSKLMVA